MATEDLASIRKQSVESINRCTDYVLKHLNGDEKNSKITELMSYIQDYCSLDEVLTSEDFKGYISEGDSVDDISNKIAELCTKSKHSNHDYMKSFLEKIETQKFHEMPVEFSSTPAHNEEVMTPVIVLEDDDEDTIELATPSTLHLDSSPDTF